MDTLNGVIDMIMNIVNKVFGYMDSIMGAFVKGENKYIIYAVILYILGTFGMAKVNLKVDTKK